jgi:uncharacterized delta-60 repeat protein
MKTSAFAALFTCSIASAPAFATNGDLDPSFGVDGVGQTMVTNAQGNGAYGPVVDSQGRILVCDTITSDGSTGSDMLVARFLPDGTLDAGFSFDGKVTIDFDAGQGHDACTGIAVQADDKVVLVGSTSNTTAPDGDFAVARLDVDGTLDTSFGAGTGKVTIPFNLGGTNSDAASAVAIDAQNRIVVAGTVTTASNGADFGVARLLPDGTLDSAFNLTGKISVGFDLAGSATKNDTLAALTFDAAGRIVLVGVADKSTDPTTASEDFAIARVLANGQLDPNFDADGRQTVAFDLGGGNDDQALAVAVLHDGRIVLVGAADTSTVIGTKNYSMAAVRMLADGSLDSGFGIGGKTLIPFDLTPNGADVALGVAEQADGKVILSGYSQHDSGTIDSATARLNLDGSLDGSWGTLGKLTYDLGLSVPSSQVMRGIAISHGHIYVSGGVLVDNTTDEVDDFVAELQDDLIFASSFE